MFCCDEYKKLFKGVKNGAKVAIWGASDVGHAIFDELQNLRKDVEIKFFADSFKSGEMIGLPIYSISEFEKHLNEIDTVIVSSFLNARIIKITLNVLGVKSAVYVTKKLVDDVCLEKFKKAKSVFKTAGDKKIYQMMVNARLERYECTIVEKWAKKNLTDKICGNDPNEYLEHVNKSAIKTVLDCGAHDGFHSVFFLTEFKNCEKVYAFEPLYDNFKVPNLDFLVQKAIKAGKIEIIYKALWDKVTTLDFRNDSVKSGSAIVEAKPNISRKQEIVQVQTTTIDDFVAENKIAKVDFIKMDLENSEMHALCGAEKTILRDRPQLAICIYHSMEHFVGIPVYLKNLLPNYVFRLGHYSSRIVETVMYAIPKELI